MIGLINQKLASKHNKQEKPPSPNPQNLRQLQLSSWYENYFSVKWRKAGR